MKKSVAAGRRCLEHLNHYFVKDITLARNCALFGVRRRENLLRQGRYPVTGQLRKLGMMVFDISLMSWFLSIGV